MHLSVGLGALLIATLATNPDPGRLPRLLGSQLRVEHLVLAYAFGFFWVRVVSAFGITDYRPVSARREILRILIACLVGALPVFAYAGLSPNPSFRLTTAALFWMLATSATLTIRGMVRAVDAPARARPVQRRIIIVGSGLRALKLSRQVLADDGSELVGFVDDNEEVAFPEVEQRLLGRLSDLDRILMRQVVDEVLIALPIRSRYNEIQRSIQICERVGVESKYLADLFQVAVARAHHEAGSTGSLVAMKIAPDDYRLGIKRAIDVIGALGGLIVLSPVLLAIALAVKFTSPGPIFFGQERFGLNKRRFKMWKFRTMVTNAEALMKELEKFNEAGGPVFKMKNDPRVTPIGIFLRKLSLDELPQLWNVVKGEMSLVGPRPLPTRDVQLFDESWLMRRFSVKPGLTCLWQISGRSNIGFDDWVTLDLRYIDEWSLGMDLRILLGTFPAVIRGTGAM